MRSLTQLVQSQDSNRVKNWHDSAQIELFQMYDNCVRVLTGSPFTSEIIRDVAAEHQQVIENLFATNSCSFRR